MGYHQTNIIPSRSGFKIEDRMTAGNLALCHREKLLLFIMELCIPQLSTQLHTLQLQANPHVHFQCPKVLYLDLEIPSLCPLDISTGHPPCHDITQTL